MKLWAKLMAAGAAACAAALPVAAQAEVTEADASGFTAHGTARVAATPHAAWEALIQPARYWNGEHSWSGDAANMTLEPVAGSCFCEALPASGGSVEHARVLYAAPGEMLRLRGSLGPLQAEALTGTLTVTLKAVDGGTEISWDYVVGGHARFGLEQLAPVVDGVIGEQFGRLADGLGRLPG
jgi:carbon monoxide dehydrogenase subunit G